MQGTYFSTQFRQAWEQTPKGLPLVIGLHGFSDAGNVIDQLIPYITERESTTKLAEFSNDEFLDYRARRPTITFQHDHLSSYEPDLLALYLAHDELGEPFLFLAGYEPDFRWERFLQAVEMIISEFHVTLTTWIHAIPMPVPHTRPIGVTVSGNQRDLIESTSVWQPVTKLTASVGHAIEHRLYAKELPIVGFVLLVPHYLGNTHYPQGLITALDCVMKATGLLFSTVTVEEDLEAFLEQVQQQVADNEESVEMVTSLEGRYDEFMRQRESKAEAGEPLASDESELPTAEQIASQLEDFLAEHWGESPPENGDGTLPPLS